MLLSADDLLGLSTTWERLELIDGRITPRPGLGGYASVVTTYLAIDIMNSVGKNEYAVALMGAGHILGRRPDTVLCPNLSVSYRSRYPDGQLPDGFAEFAPDISCDTLYPEERLPILEWRANRFLDSGVRLHWIINPFTKTITSYSPNNAPTVLRVGDILSVDAILPGLSFSIDEVFDR